MKPIIRVENLGKQYRIGRREAAYATLRESLVGAARAPFDRLRRGFRREVSRDTASDRFWALKDVGFEVLPGEVVGVIGHNGAGKSTLLKLLSRITEPTTGAIHLYGRVSSLLEVGTGFHPELTGRENIYLNGNILGMKRREINRLFSEIVAFAEVEKFLDTPVKRYSSGMVVRLGFAVAAHLDPEIMIVDEVLAVGDAAFQKRCLRKMGEVSHSGKTILIVSHNLATIRVLCNYAMILHHGRIAQYGKAERVVSEYLSSIRENTEKSLAERTDREGNGKARVVSIRFSDEQGNFVTQALTGCTLRVITCYRSHIDNFDTKPVVALSFWTSDGQKLFHVDNAMRNQDIPFLSLTGSYICEIPRLNIAPGQYHVNVMITDQTELVDHVVGAAQLAVLPGDYYGTGQITQAHGGLIHVDHNWIV